MDSKRNLPIDFNATNTNDSRAMGIMLQRLKSILPTNDFIALYDKGYHTSSEFTIVDILGIKTLVAIPAVAAQAPNSLYNVEQFKYNREEDNYTCQQKQKLTSTGKLHQAKTYQFKRYTTKACLHFRVKGQCSKTAYGKAIQRSEYQDRIEKNMQRIKQNESYYKLRQAIVEHSYGTIKRQWGFDHIMTKKTIERASVDVGLIMIAYSLRRIINIIGIKRLISYMTETYIFLCIYFNIQVPKPAHMTALSFMPRNINTISKYPFKRLFLERKPAA